MNKDLGPKLKGQLPGVHDAWIPKMKKQEGIRLLIRFGHLTAVTCVIGSSCGGSSYQAAFVVDFGFPPWVRTKMPVKCKRASYFVKIDYQSI